MPRIAEVNAICGELGKDNFLYEPEIITEIQQDGRKISRIVIRVYVDKNVRDIYSQLAYSVFSDTVYEKVKELYENQFDDDNEG